LREELYEQYMAHAASPEPVLAEEYDVSKWGSMPWNSLYAKIFRDEEKVAYKDLADKLSKAEQGSELAQVVTLMGFEIDPAANKPTSDDIYNYLKKQI